MTAMGSRIDGGGLRLPGAALGTRQPALAQDYPSKTVTLVVPAAPGGVIDTLGRTLAQKFSEAWGRQVVVEHRPGANNQIAAEYVTKAPPDGHTLLISPEVTFAVNPSLYKRLPYDPVKGFTPITGLVTINHGLIASRRCRSQASKDIIALAKNKPGCAQLRHVRRRLERPSQHGNVPDHVRHEVHRGPLQGRDAGADRRDRRPHPDDVHQRRQRGAAMAGGQGEAPRRRRRGTHGAAAARCRPSRKADCRATRRCRGSRCSGRPACRQRSSPSSMPRCGASLPTRSSSRRSLDKFYFTPIVGSPEELTARIRPTSRSGAR